MQGTIPLFERQFFQAFRRTLSTSNSITLRFCTLSTNSSQFLKYEDKQEEINETVDDLKSTVDENEEPKSLCGRIVKLDKGEPVNYAFQSWMGDGFPIHRGDIFHTINRLRKHKYNKRALEVMEWVIRERPYMPKQLDYSYLLEFTAKLHGISQGEKLFSHIPSEFQDELLYNNLVIACLDKGMIRLSLAYMKKMRELGYSISYLVFNRLIILHSSPTRKKLIPKILTQMKADKVARHVSTYNILLKMEANQHNIEGLLKVFSDMKRANTEPNEITYCIIATAHAVARLYTACETYVEAIEKSMTGNNWSTLDILIMLYGYLKKPKDLERIWRVVLEQPHVKSKSYVLAIEAFGRIGDTSRAEDLWSELKSKSKLKSTEQFNSLISVYCRHGYVSKATGLYKEMEKYGCKANSITFRHLAFGCLKSGLKMEALKTLELGKDLITSTSVKKSTPWLETTYSLIDLFAESGDVANVEKLFDELKKANYAKYTFVYNALIKAYVKAKIYDPNLLRRMILGGSRPDSETYSLLKVLEQFRG
ncbi:pentatricopeptide repeat-containing protein At1g07590, mitochondrial [Rutidosis leptorrhynchoides]|uniref:pentatricopeptide repeat-containing protein At1g07590, mitochondrial n=1 Tax=Rutidosis leptorrhynchoides TaxID=125765 RepID=UPI003A991EC1